MRQHLILEIFRQVDYAFTGSSTLTEETQYLFIDIFLVLPVAIFSEYLMLCSRTL